MATPKRKAPAKKKAAPKSKAKPATKGSKAKAPAKMVNREVQNEITRPMKDGATKRVWEIADSLNKGKNVATRGAVMEAGLAEGLNEATIATQFARWRKFNGIEGRTKKAA